MKIACCIYAIIGMIFTPLNLIDGNILGALFGAMAFICGVVGLLFE